MSDDKDQSPPPDKVPTGSTGDSQPAPKPSEPTRDQIPTGNPGSTGPDIKVE